jgi:uncharacterized membrane protein
MDIERTIEIAASAERVWHVMIDVQRWPEWTPTVTSVERPDTGPLKVGSRARLRQPRLPPAVWTVTALDAGRYFEWQNVTPGVKSVAGHRVETIGGRTTRATLTFEWTGWLAPLIRLLYGRLARRYVQTEAESLKRRCEGQR